MKQFMKSLVVLCIAISANAGVTTHFALDTTHIISDGMTVGPVTEIAYSPLDAGHVSVEINGREVLSSTEPGTYEWHPERPGTYVLTHRAGENVVTRSVLFAGSDDAKELEIGWLDKPLSELFPTVYDSVTNIVIAPTLTDIPENAFVDCTALASVTIPESVKRIGANAFAGCTSLTSLTLPTGLDDLSLDVIPEHLRATLGLKYDDDGFMVYDGWLLDCEDKSALTLVVLEGVIGIGSSALADMDDFESVELPSTVKKIGKDALVRSPGSKFVVSSDNPYYESDEGFLFDKGKKTLIRAPRNVAAFDLPSSVVRISERACYGCALPTVLKLQGGIKEIGDEAFADSNVWVVMFEGDAPQSVSDSAFKGLQSVFAYKETSGWPQSDTWKGFPFGIVDRGYVPTISGWRIRESVNGVA